MSGAPFDVLGDTLRGTHAIMMDMYRRPEKILQAVERLVPILIRRGVKGANATGNPLITLPLHKGADSFMSDAQFQKFYWPTLKKVILGLIEEGCVPMPFAEGSYNLRLKYLAELPPGKTAWFFDQTDMIKAKEAIGDRICLIGNVPSSLMISAEPRKVEEYCQVLIDKVGKGGGFIMANGSALDEAKPENLRAMIEYTKKHGKYS
jgi:uroporphyrinogen-III decarboxylase